MIRKMLWGFMVLVMGLACITLSARLTFAQLGGLEGDVKGTDGLPMVGVEVQIDRKEIKQHFQTKTDKKGHYYHTGLPSGTYRVSIWQEGKEISFHDNVRVRLGDATTHDFDLKADQEAAQKAMPKELKEQYEKIEKQKKAQGDLQQHFNDGNTFFNNKQYDQALTEYKTAAELDPTQHAVFAKLAETYSQLRQFDDALASYQKAISLLEAQTEQKPDTKLNLASYYNNYGGVLAKAGKTKEAIDIYKKAAAINPENAGMYYFNLGAVLTNTRAPLQDRVDAFKKAAEADPKNANAWYQLGVTLSEKMTTNKDGSISAPPEMVEALNKYLELEPTGRFAEGAKGLISVAGEKVTTQIGTRKDDKKKKK